MKSIIIFGGSRGIGKIIAKNIIEKCDCISIFARDEKQLFETRSEFKNKSINIIKGDIGNSDDVKSAFENHYKLFGNNPEVVINAAAIQGAIGPLWELDDDKINETMHIDLIAAMYVTKYAVKSMMSRGYGSIILFSGGGAAYARPYFTSYGVAKTGILRLVETVSEELKDKGYDKIIINAIAPGAVKTRMMDEIVYANDKAGKKALEEAEKIIKDGGTSDELIMKLISFLSDFTQNKYLSGRLIHVREDYLSFIKKWDPSNDTDAGLLRRIPLELK